MQQTDESYVPALRFRWLTPYYDAVVKSTTRERTFKQALLRQAAIGPNHRILDLACGTGTLSVWIKESHPQAEVVGADGDAAVLSLAARKAKEAGASVRFDQAMSFDLPYRSSELDRVLSSLFFHHLSWKDKLRTAQEVYRVLRPAGQLHVADWGKPTSILMRGLFVPVQLLDGFSNTRDNVAGNLIQLFETAGFAEVSQARTFSTIFGTLALYSAVKPARTRDPVS